MALISRARQELLLKAVAAGEAPVFRNGVLILATLRLTTQRGDRLTAAGRFSKQLSPIVSLDSFKREAERVKGSRVVVGTLAGRSRVLLQMGKGQKVQATYFDLAHQPWMA